MMRGFGYGPMMGGYAGWYGGILMFLFGTLAIAGIVLLIIWAVRQSGGHHQAAGPQQPGHPMQPGAAPPQPPMPTGAAGHDEAVAIAKKRLASGEITPQQYQEIMQHLGS